MVANVMAAPVVVIAAVVVVVVVTAVMELQCEAQSPRGHMDEAMYKY